MLFSGAMLWLILSGRRGGGTGGIHSSPHDLGRVESSKLYGYAIGYQASGQTDKAIQIQRRSWSFLTRSWPLACVELSKLHRARNNAEACEQVISLAWWLPKVPADPRGWSDDGPVEFLFSSPMCRFLDWLGARLEAELKTLQPLEQWQRPW